MAEGYVMTIPKKVLEQLTKADDKINQISESSKKAASVVEQSFKSMTSSLAPFVDQLNRAKEGMKSLVPKTGSKDIGKLADNIAAVSVGLNKVSESPVDIVNKKIESLKNLLNDSQSAVTKLNTQLSTLKATGSGQISMTTIKEGNASTALSSNIQAEIKILEQQKRSILATQNAWNEYVGTINGTSLAALRQQAAMEKLNSSFRTGNSALQQRQKMMDDAFNAAYRTAEAEEKLVKKQDELNKKRASASETRAATQAESAYNRAMMATEGTMTQRINKIAKLKQAQDQLSATGKNYSTQLTKIAVETERLQKANLTASNATDKLKQSQSRVLDTTAQLQRNLALLFSVSAIQGYISKLVQVRGEFEIQQRSLQAILQNKDQADALFEKTVSLAIKSPYTIKELIRYTKQLAAYRIETEKLYDTTKMLADISSGLGVDMNRLILAFGQVKAANYLRGQELRQFSEAGVNILGELATYFTELEGRMVSVGEVFEMVSKRMVSFGDVEEIFKRLTSAGGIFYNMQEIQAETLQGQLANLEDSFDIMLNDIGKSNDGLLKSFVSTARSIVENWEIVADVILPIIAGFGIYKTSLLAITAYEKASLLVAKMINVEKAKEIITRQLIRKGIQAEAAATTASEMAQHKFNAAAKANPYIFAASVILSAIIGISSAIKTARKDQEEFNKTISDGLLSASEMSANFKRLADIAIDSSKSAKEQKDAMDELNRTYRDILPAQTLQIDNLKKMKGNYDAVTTAIYAKIEAQTRDKLSQQVQGQEGSKAVDAITDLSKALEDFGISSATSKKIAADFRKEIENGTVKTTGDAQKSINKLISLYTDLNKVFGRTETGDIDFSDTKSYVEAFSAITKLQKKVSEVNEMTIFPQGDVSDRKIYNDLKAQLDEISSYTAEFKEKNQKNFNDSYSLNEASEEKTKKKYKDFINSLEKQVSSGNFEFKDIEIINKFIEKAQKAIDSLDGTPAQQEIRRISLAAYQLNNANLDGLSKVFLGSEETITEYTKRIKDSIQSLSEAIIVFNKNPFLSPYTAEDIKEKTKELAAQKVILSNLPDLSSPKGKESEIEKRLKNQISLIQKVGQEYKKNLKLYSDEEALEKTKKDYEKAFALAGFQSNFLATMTLDATGIISGLEKISKGASENLKIEIEKAISDLRGDVEITIRTKKIEDFEKQIDDMFSGYELNLELEKLGFDKDLIKQIFKIDINDIKDIRSALTDMYPDVSKLSEEQLNSYNKISKKISNIEDKEMIDRLKNYTSYLKKSTSERIRLKLEELRKINEIEKIEEYTPEQKETAKKSVKRETTQKLQSQEWADFKGSDMYIQMFGDLETMGAQSIATLKEKLEELKGSLTDLPVTDVKEIMGQIEKLENLQIKANPFASLRDAMKEVNALQKEGKTEESLQLTLQQAEQQRATAQQELDAIDLILNARQENISLESMGIQWQQQYVDLLGMGTDELNQQRNAQQAIVNNSKITSANANKDLSSYAKARKSLNYVSQEWDSIRQISSQAFDSIKTILTSMGVESDSTAMVLADMGGSLIDLVAQAVLFGAQLKLMTLQAEILGKTINSALGPIGWAVMALQGIATIFSAIFSISDKRREREIEKEKEKVEALEQAYEKLEKTIENGLSIDVYSKNADRIKLLQQQVQSYYSMIKSEQGKKDPSDDAIKGWRNDIADINAQIEDLFNGVKEQLLSTFKDISNQLGDAITNAFAEGTDAAKAWGDTAHDIMSDILKNLIIQKFIEPKVQEWFDKYYAALMPATSDAEAAHQRYLEAQAKIDYADKELKGNADFIFGMFGNSYKELKAKAQKAYDEWMAAEEAAKGEVPNLDEEVSKNFAEGLENIFDSINGQIPEWLKEYLGQNAGATELDTLNKGIQGVTETTAAALEALLNSMRFFVASSNEEIIKISSYLSPDPETNPLLSELKTQTALIRSIDSLLSSVTKAGHSQGGMAIKVIMS